MSITSLGAIEVDEARAVVASTRIRTLQQAQPAIKASPLFEFDAA